jgi:hypothetical protein
MPQCGISSLTPSHDVTMHDATMMGTTTTEQGMITMGEDGNRVGYDNGVV